MARAPDMPSRTDSGISDDAKPSTAAADAEAPAVVVQHSFASVQPDLPRKPNYWISCCKACVLLCLALLCQPIWFGTAIVLSFALTGVSIVAGLPIVFLILYFYSFMPHNDLYTQLLLLSYKVLFFARYKPTARGDMLPGLLRPKEQLEKRAIAYAVNILVPLSSEEEFKKDRITFTSTLGILFEENLHRLPYYQRNAAFAPGEDPVEYVMSYVGDVFPNVNQIYREKTSDEACTQLAFFGLGAHRIEVETETRTDEHGNEVEAKMYVVRTNQLSQLPVREGFETYGGDAYFDAEWRIEKICFQMQLASEGLPGPLVTVRPGERGWEYAKFCWRSSLFSFVTLVDHLYGVHMQAGNACVVAMRQQLSKDHPIRRFLTPFSFQTISVNDNARNNLVNPRSMGPRCFALTDIGMDLAWSAAPTLLQSGVEAAKAQTDPKLYWTALLDRGWYIENWVKPRLGKLTPWWEQALEFWNVQKAFVTAFMESYWSGPEALLQDKEAFKFLVQSVSIVQSTSSDAITHLAELPAELSAEIFWDATINLIARYTNLVTAGHEQVGTVPVYAQDASFCAFAWKKGEMMATKQAALNAAVLMAFTSTPMPPLMRKTEEDDWSFLFPSEWKSADVPSPKARADAAYNQFQADLARLEVKSQAFNDAALAADATFPNNFGIWAHVPSLLECSVSV